MAKTYPITHKGKIVRVTVPERDDSDPSEIIAEIARKHLRIETLEEQKSDRVDFHDLHVLAIKAALEAAFQAGREATK